MVHSIYTVQSAEHHLISLSHALVVGGKIYWEKWMNRTTCSILPALTIFLISFGSHIQPRPVGALCLCKMHSKHSHSNKCHISQIEWLQIKQQWVTLCEHALDSSATAPRHDLMDRLADRHETNCQFAEKRTQNSKANHPTSIIFYNIFFMCQERFPHWNASLTNAWVECLQVAIAIHTFWFDPNSKLEIVAQSHDEFKIKCRSQIVRFLCFGDIDSSRLIANPGFSHILLFP